MGVSYATGAETASASVARLRADFAQIPVKAKSLLQKVIHIADAARHGGVRQPEGDSPRTYCRPYSF
jgi:hypothetical protein